MKRTEPLSYFPSEWMYNDLKKSKIIDCSKRIVCSFDLYYLKKLIKEHKGSGELTIIQSKETDTTYIALIGNSKRRKTIKALACKVPIDTIKDALDGNT